MDYATVCSGIEAPSCAWHPLGWRPVFFSEIEPFPCAVLEQRWLGVPNRGDMTRFKDWPDASIALLCGGTPCQSFSVAGLRKGLADPRGNLTLTFLAVAARYRPEWVVWENVPGVLSDRTGAFGAFLGGLAELGYGWAYRVLDAQYFGVPQRRRRVLVVGRFGDWRLAAAVLFERHSMQGHPAPSRETGARASVGALAGTSPGGGWRIGADEAAAGQLVEAGGYVNDVSRALTACATATGRLDPNEMEFVAETLRGHPRPGSNSLGAIAFDWYASRSQGMPTINDGSPSLKTTMQPAIMNAMQVRRLTPRECERLQGFTDDYTLVTNRGKPAADGPRYKALGNSMAVPVVRWIGERIEMCRDGRSG